MCPEAKPSALHNCPNYARSPLPRPSLRDMLYPRTLKSFPPNLRTVPQLGRVISYSWAMVKYSYGMSQKLSNLSYLQFRPSILWFQQII